MDLYFYKIFFDKEKINCKVFIFMFFNTYLTFFSLLVGVGRLLFPQESQHRVIEL